ncbi:hypothetical protein [Aeromonas allosaccharophila]|uniref:hypothetical protein n=1 Tax=Aeromonas allosaccharophila TaxID=656 RepID=UPI001C566758|nr:hypothetical protein [Aeromonas allosaccharophila]
MKLLMPCMTCFQELGKPTLEFATLEFRDDGRYEVCCSRGHKSVTILQQQKFEVLFDIGANAIIDGYYREAISSFTSSMERFYEFCIKVLCEKRKLEGSVFLSTWKEVSNQSERQLGAFLFLWAVEFGEIPVLLPKKDIAFRNSVIHKGRIPTKNEALEYGNTILNIIRPKIEQLKRSCSEEISKVTFKHILSCSELTNEQVSGGVMCANTIVSLASGEESKNQQSLEEAISSVSKWRETLSSIQGITGLSN